MSVDEDEDGPEPKTIHRRFALALLAEALADAGQVHLDYRVEREPETIHVWEPRRSANDPAPPAPPDPDPTKRFGQAAVVPPAGEPIPLEGAPKDPVLRACRQTYRRWARALDG